MSDDRPTEPEQPTTPVPADQPTEPVAPAAAPVPPPVPPTGYVPPAPPAPTGHEGWPPAEAAPEWHAAQFTTGSVETAPSRKGLAITALILGIAAVVFALLGFVPIIGFAFLGFGGLLGVVALILGIIALTGKNTDGRAAGLTGIILGAIGVLLAIAAVVFQAVFLVGLANTTGHSASGSTSEVAPSPSTSDGADDSAAPDEQAFLAEVKPQLLDIWRSIQPSASSLPWSDDFLVSAGQQIESAGTDDAERSTMKKAFVQAATDKSNGVITSDQASQIFDVLAQGADDHLAQ